MILIRSCHSGDIHFALQAMEELAGHSFEKTTFYSVFLKNLINDNLHYLIAEYNHTNAGFACLSIQNHLHHAGLIAEIQELVVMPPYRNTGIGKQLLDHLTVLAKQNGCCLIELASSKTRIDAHRFYLREGFIDSHHKFTKKL